MPGEPFNVGFFFSFLTWKCKVQTQHADIMWEMSSDGHKALNVPRLMLQNTHMHNMLWPQPILISMILKSVLREHQQGSRSGFKSPNPFPHQSRHVEEAPTSPAVRSRSLGKRWIREWADILSCSPPCKVGFFFFLLGMAVSLNKTRFVHTLICSAVLCSRFCHVKLPQ